MHTEEDREVSESYIDIEIYYIQQYKHQLNFSRSPSLKIKAMIKEEMGISRVYHQFCDIFYFTCISN